MQVLTFTLLFVAALLGSLVLDFWLATRQMRHVAAHRGKVPAAFASTVPLEAHQRAADYTIAKGRFGLITSAFGAAVLLGWTLLGGLEALNESVRDAVLPRFGPLAYEVALLAAFGATGGLLGAPFSWFSTFRIEQRFGFNRTRLGLWLADAAKSAAVAAVIGLPIAAGVLWIMRSTGGLWWFWAWAAWIALNLVILVLYPTVIAPLFNRFEPLSDPALKTRVEALMARCGFAARGLFVMDASRRSAHGNAYFTGFGAAKRVVLFDTLVERLTPNEIEAVLAHELGHFHHRHVLKRIVWSFLLALAGFALLGWIARQSWFYLALGVTPSFVVPNDALALLLFTLVLPVFGSFVAPLVSQLSRRDEFEADRYASHQVGGGRELATALLKLHQDNATTLTPDPLYVRFYHSHPPASERLAALSAGH